ncbi:MAG TPA: FAD-dependent oxidoreductase [Solirubrobacteraceae bacterium]
MQVDATTLPPDAELKAEVAVLGAGPAGITLALELAAAGHSVALIESGSDAFDAEVQALGDAILDDPAHMPMAEATRRQIGGASNIWGGRCVPFDAIDFQTRAVAGDAQWPVSYEEIQRHYARACEWCVCGKQDIFDARELPELAGRSLIPGWPEGDIRATTIERWSLPTNFAREYGRRLQESQLVTLTTRLTCTEILVGEDGYSVTQLATQTLAGNCASVKAARYVLACGGLESTRLLLASNRVHTRGIGNHAGHLGRWYMAHIEARIARVHFSTQAKQTIYSYERDPDGVYVRRRFTITPEQQLRDELPNAAMWLENPEIGNPAHRSGPLSFVYLMLVSPLGRHLISEGIRKHQLGDTRLISTRAHLANVLRSPLATTSFALALGYGRFLKRGRKLPGFFIPSRTNVYPLLYQSEHLPHRDSHVVLSAERDALGVPRLRPQMHIDERDIDGVIRAHEHFDRYLREHSLGHLEYIVEDFAKAIRDRFFYGCHQSGTTRMSARSEDGVLDANLAVHGFTDLFVASSSAFVTSSQANSTFTIVAFALRLAEHLHATLEG